MLSEENVIEAIKGVCPGLEHQDMPSDAELKSIGVDSLDFFNVLVELETMTGKSVPDEKVENLKTINDLLKYFA